MDHLESIIQAANAAEQLGIIGMLFLINVIAVGASVAMYREVKKCRSDIVELLTNDWKKARS